MLGTGVSSFGYLSGIHAQNTANWTEYVKDASNNRLPLERAFVTSDEDRLIRETILQLKTGELTRSHFLEKFSIDIFNHFAPAWRRLQSRQMLYMNEDGVELTRRGLLQADALLPEFYAKQYRNSRYT